MINEIGVNKAKAWDNIVKEIVIGSKVPAPWETTIDNENSSHEIKDNRRTDDKMSKSNQVNLMTVSPNPCGEQSYDEDKRKVPWKTVTKDENEDISDIKIEDVRNNNKKRGLECQGLRPC